MRRKMNNAKKYKIRRRLFVLAVIIIIISITVVVKNKLSNNKENTAQLENQKIANLQEIQKENTEKTNSSFNIQNIDNINDNIVDKENSNAENNNTIKNDNTTMPTNVMPEKTLKNGLPVLMYHFFYDESIGEEGVDNNYMEISDFEEQIKYLSENNFYYPTWEEVEDYIDGKIELPEKSIVITVDDGDDSFFKYAVPIIQKYNAKATSFVVSDWYGYRAAENQPNISYQSHSHTMHEAGANGKGVMLSWSYDKILKDVKDSSMVLGGATIFCYPFGQYNDTSIQILKDAGYKLAFTTEGGRVYKGSSKYELPRVRMSKGISLNSFASMVK